MNEIDKALLSLNYQLTSKALALWNGNERGNFDSNPYSGFDHLLTRKILDSFRPVGQWSKSKHRVFHTLLGHYLQYRISPYENELFTWMRGAAAHVQGEKIYFRHILSWCQKRSDLEKRRIVQEESRRLCKFLQPFSVGLWEFLLELLKEEFSYENYVQYCSEKKQVDYEVHLLEVEEVLRQTRSSYFKAMEAWAQKSLATPLEALNRFDAIYLLGLGEFDECFPGQMSLREHLAFFHEWGVQVDDIPGLSLHIDPSPKRSGQAMTFAAKIPDEIHLVMNPQGGWIDLETLFHEMGHALSHAFTSPDLAPADKDFFTSNTLSETYAFLLQNMCFSPVFLERHLRLSPKAIEKIAFYKVLKDLSVFRRYAGKFLAEYRIFKENSIENGRIYADLMKEHTGFLYHPETHLFDLVAEFYSLDYVVSWMAEATMEKTLVTAFGDDWMFKQESGKTLKEWWLLGNRYGVDEFFSNSGIGIINREDILSRWRTKLSKYS